MRSAFFGIVIAPLALLGAGHEAKAFPLHSHSESVPCAAVGNDRMMRAALGCPSAAYVLPSVGGPFIRVQGPSESLMCAVAGNDRMMRAVLGCSMF